MKDLKQHKNVQRYLQRLERALSREPEPDREELLREVMSHIAEGLHLGRPAEEILTELGPPEEVAAQFATVLRQARDTTLHRVLFTLLPTLLALAGYALARPDFGSDLFNPGYPLVRLISCLALAVGSVYLWRQGQYGLASLWALYVLGFSFLMGGLTSAFFDLLVRVFGASSSTGLPGESGGTSTLLFLSLLAWSLIVAYLVLQHPGKERLAKEHLKFGPWIILPGFFFLAWNLLEVSRSPVASYALWSTGVALLLTQLDVVIGHSRWRLEAGVTALQVGLGIMASLIATNTWLSLHDLAIGDHIAVPTYAIVCTPALLLAAWRVGAILYDTVSRLRLSDFSRALDAHS